MPQPDAVPMPQPESAAARFGSWDLLVLAPGIVWLYWAAFSLDIELFDGLDCLSNTYFFLGDVSYYLPNRWPMISLLLVPAAWFVEFTGMPRLELRPYHLLMATYLTGYLVLSYAVLRRHATWRPAAVIAMIAAIYTFMFFSYGAFLNHDVLPGAFLLAMTVAGYRYLEKPDGRLLIALVVLGAMAALVKPSNGSFWFGVLVAAGVHTLHGRFTTGEWKLRRFVALGMCSVLSAGVYWLVMTLIMRGSADAPGISQPVGQLASGYIPHLPSMLYLVRFPAYGWLTAALIPVALVSGLLQAGRYRFYAIVWLICYFALSTFGWRELRYIAFLMPLSALLLIPTLTWLAKIRWLRIAILAVLAVHVAFAAREALRLRLPFYRHNLLDALIADLETTAGSDLDRILIANNLTLLPPLTSPLVGDPHHRGFTLDGYHLRNIERKPSRFDRARSFEDFLARIGGDASVALIMQRGQWRPPDHPTRQTTWDASQISTFYSVEIGRITAAADGSLSLYPAGSQTPIALQVSTITAAAGDTEEVVLQSPALTRSLAGAQMPTLCAPGGESQNLLQSRGDDRYAITGLRDPSVLTKRPYHSLKALRAGPSLQVGPDTPTMTLIPAP